MKRAYIFLEDGEWERADDFFEQVLNVNPECAEAYLGKLMVEFKVHTKEELKETIHPFSSNNNYKRALRYANEELKEELLKHIEYIENNRNYEAYLDAIRSKDSAATSEEYKEAGEKFKLIAGYKDASALGEECFDISERLETEKKDSIYSEAIELMERKPIPGYEDKLLQWAIEKFSLITDWKDSTEKIDECKKRLERIKARNRDDMYLQPNEIKWAYQNDIYESDKPGCARKVWIAVIVGVLLALLLVWSDSQESSYERIGKSTMDKLQNGQIYSLTEDEEQYLNDFFEWMDKN